MCCNKRGRARGASLLLLQVGHAGSPHARCGSLHTGRSNGAQQPGRAVLPCGRHLRRAGLPLQESERRLEGMKRQVLEAQRTQQAQPPAATGGSWQPADAEMAPPEVRRAQELAQRAAGPWPAQHMNAAVPVGLPLATPSVVAAAEAAVAQAGRRVVVRRSAAPTAAPEEEPALAAGAEAQRGVPAAPPTPDEVSDERAAALRKLRAELPGLLRQWGTEADGSLTFHFQVRRGGMVLALVGGPARAALERPAALYAWSVLDAACGGCG